MTSALSHRGALLAAALLGFAATTAAFLTLELPGLGLGHFFYVPIALVALASGGAAGAAAGGLATVLYAVGVVLNPHLPGSDALSFSTLIRATTFVAIGALVGTFARANRDLVARLSELADRDYLTGLRNTRVFEASLRRRCAEARRFALVLCDLDGLKATNDRDGHAAGNALLRRVAVALQADLRAEDEVARIGGDEFALLSRVATAQDAEALCDRLEGELDRQGLATSLGWAVFPQDGGSADALYRRADERLYASKERRRARAQVAALLPLRRSV